MVLLVSALGRKCGQTAFKDQPRLKHLPGLKTMKGSHKAKVRFGEFGWPIGDEGSHSVPHLHDAHGRQIANSRAQTGAADLERPCKLPFRWYFVTGLESAILNQSAHVVNHMHRSMGIDDILFLPHSRKTILLNPAKWRQNEINIDESSLVRI